MNSLQNGNNGAAINQLEAFINKVEAQRGKKIADAEAIIELIQSGLEKNNNGETLALSDHTPQSYSLNQNYPNPFNPSTQIRFGIPEASNVKIYLFANAVEIETNSAGREAMRVLVTTLSGRRSSITAKVFILACGALENARLLLVSNRVPTRGLGNANDLVGRFFMEHLSIPAALFLPSDPHLPMGLYSQQTTSGTRALGYLAFPPETLRREELLNVRIIVAEASLQELTSKASQGVLSAGFLWNAFQRRELADDFTKHLLNVIGDIDDVAIHSYERAFAPRTGAFVINVDMEQAPRADSRVSLMSTRDRFGLQRLQLSWRFESLEKETLRRVNDILALELGRAGLGRLKVLPDDEQTGWPTGLRGAWHQMGTTRMSTDPKLGVVDATCKVHGISNVFIAGSSVFPTSGYTNPTLTIVALAVRLADHIKKHLA